jgi:hypothetical protein
MVAASRVADEVFPPVTDSRKRRASSPHAHDAPLPLTAAF